MKSNEIKNWIEKREWVQFVENSKWSQAERQVQRIKFILFEETGKKLTKHLHHLVYTLVQSDRRSFTQGSLLSEFDLVDAWTIWTRRSAPSAVWRDLCRELWTSNSKRCSRQWRRHQRSPRAFRPFWSSHGSFSDVSLAFRFFSWSADAARSTESSYQSRSSAPLSLRALFSAEWSCWSPIRSWPD